MDKPFSSDLPAAQRRHAEAVVLRIGPDPAELAALVPAIERYVEAVAIARRLWRAIPGGKTGLIVDGSKSEVINPLIAAALNAEKAAAQFGRALGVEPEPARRAPGRPRGATSAPDRTTAPPKVTRLRAVGE